MTTIADNLRKLLAEIPPEAKLIAVSKNQSVDAILEAYQAGQRIFGENKAQELITKAPQAPGNIEWHFIGHLQTNKIRQIIPYASLIHSVDSFRLLREISREAGKQGRNTRCLLQFHIAEEDTKYGLSLEEAEEFLDQWPIPDINHVSLCGVMGMATFTDDENVVAREFAHLHEIYLHLKSKYFPLDDSFKEISMGMSDDYRIAIQHGSTMVRVGTRIFGHR
ncbi:MAG: YggS family pyridoxal phosphate-dependent enzyme [Bacteroidales bacterium]